MGDEIAVCRQCGERVAPCVQKGCSSPAAEMTLAAMGLTLAQLLKRPEIEVGHLVQILRESKPEFFGRERVSADSQPSTASVSSAERHELKSLETEIKYEGSLLQQKRATDRLKKTKQRTIPDWFNYGSA